MLIRFWGLIIINISIAVMFNSCGKKLEVSNSFSSQSVCLKINSKQTSKLNILTNSHANKLSLRKNKFKASNKNSFYSSGEVVLVTADNLCIQELTSYNLKNYPTKDLYFNKRLSSLDFQTYNYINKTTRSHQELLNHLSTDPCIVGVSKVLPYKLSNLRVDINSNKIEEEGFVYARQLRTKIAHDILYNGLINQKIKIKVAVIDSGIDLNHPDLAGQASTQGVDVACTQTPCSLDSYSKLYGENESVNSHGTHVAGIIGAAKNTQGTYGIASNNIDLIRIKIFKEINLNDSNPDNNDLGTTNSLVIAGIERAISSIKDGGFEANVINLSLGSTTYDPALENAILSAVDKGVVVVMAAGNDGKEIVNRFTNPTKDSFYPAYFGSVKGAITVGSIDYRNNLSGFSNYSNTVVDIATYGEFILSTLSSSANIGSFSNNYQDNFIFYGINSDPYIFHTGTSMAAPIVSGAAALVIGYLKTKDLDYTASDVESIIKNAAIKKEELTPYINEGNYLDLERLALHIKRCY